MLQRQILWLAAPAVLLVIFSLLTGATRQVPDRDKTTHFDLKLFFKFFQNKQLCTLYFIQVCNATLLWGTMFLLPDLLNTRGYEPWIAFGWGHMMMILGGAVMMLPAGYLADRFSCRIVILTTTLVSMLLFYAVLISPTLSNEMMLVLLFGMGASLTIVNPVSIALGTRLVHNQKGMVSAFLMGMVWCVSEMIGQGGGGLLTKLFETDAPAKALAILGSLFLVGMGLAIQLPQKEDVPLQVEYI